MKITKIKRLKGDVGLQVWFIDNTDGGEMSVEYKPENDGRPHPKIISIFESLADEAKRISESNKPVEKFYIGGVNFSYGDNADSFMLNIVETLDNFPKPKCFNTPSATLLVHNAEFKEAYKNTMVPEKTIKLLSDLRIATIAYVKGERDQHKMEFKEEEE